MPNIRHIILTLIVFASFFTGVRATHILGGEMDMQFVSGNSYIISLSLYYDVLGNDEVEDSVIVSSYDKVSHQRIENFFLTTTGDYSRPVLSNTLCNEGLNIRIYTYTALVNLSSQLYNSDDGYYLSWQRCCRSSNISNMSGSGTEGFVFYMEFPNLDEYQGNSSPKFKELSGDYYCIGDTLSVDLSANDANGDELRYELTVPMVGYAYEDDKIIIGQPGPYPLSPNYTWVPGTNPGSIDNNGILRIPAPFSGLYLYSVLCSEYRGGVKIGEIRRDMMLYVKDCEARIRPGFSIKDFAGNNYEEGDTIFINNTDELCQEISLRNVEANEQLTFEVLPINFNKNVFSFNPKSQISNGDAEVQKVNFCLSECRNLDQNYFEFFVQVKDDDCPKANSFRRQVNVLVREPENAPPTVRTDHTRRNYTTGEEVRIRVIAKDQDIDQIPNLNVSGEDFSPGQFGMSFSSEVVNSERIGELIWTADCANTRDKNFFELVFTTDDKSCNENAKDSLMIPIYIERIEDGLFDLQKAPNVITANGDGVNDYFSIPGLNSNNCALDKFQKIVVFNRWGREVYSSNDIAFKFRGTDLPSGSYFYHLDLGDIHFKGFIELLR